MNLKCVSKEYKYQLNHELTSQEAETFYNTFYEVCREKDIGCSLECLTYSNCYYVKTEGDLTEEEVMEFISLVNERIVENKGYYLVTITETNFKTVKVKANSDEEAEEKVREMYENADIIINDDCETEFSVRNVNGEDLSLYEEAKEYEPETGLKLKTEYRKLNKTE